MAIRNRSYQIRSRRGGLVPVGEVLQELVERAADRQSFYRPVERKRPGALPKPSPIKKSSGKLQGVQLDLFPVEQPVSQKSDSPRDPQRPLFDVFPMAYE